MTPLHLIGGEKGGVGKSVLARLLCQYFIDHDRRFAAFDADGSHPALLRYYADFARPVDLRSFESCDGLLLTASKGTPTVVDLPAQSERALGEWLSDSGVDELADALGVQVVRWHLMDEGRDSLSLLEAALQQELRNTSLVVVRNLGRGKKFASLAASEVVCAARERGVPVVDLPGLHGNTMHKIDRLGASFWAAVHNRDPELGPCLNVLERQRVKVWMQRAFRQIEAAGEALDRRRAQQLAPASSTTDSPARPGAPETLRAVPAVQTDAKDAPVLQAPFVTGDSLN